MWVQVAATLHHSVEPIDTENLSDRGYLDYFSMITGFKTLDLEFDLVILFIYLILIFFFTSLFIDLCLDIQQCLWLVFEDFKLCEFVGGTGFVASPEPGIFHWKVNVLIRADTLKILSL